LSRRPPRSPVSGASIGIQQPPMTVWLASPHSQSSSDVVAVGGAAAAVTSCVQRNNLEQKSAERGKEGSKVSGFLRERRKREESQEEETHKHKPTSASPCLGALVVCTSNSIRWDQQQLLFLPRNKQRKRKKLSLVSSPFLFARFVGFLLWGVPFPSLAEREQSESFFNTPPADFSRRSVSRVDDRSIEPVCRRREGREGNTPTQGSQG
jgi:hypothetical protein